MNYSKYSVDTLREFHEAIQRCLDEDNQTPQGKAKPYGVCEFPDWAIHIKKIENQLSAMGASYSPIILPLVSATKTSTPTPVDYILYETIKSCLAYDDSHPNNKKYGVREFSDWRVQSDSLEKSLDEIGCRYQKIQW